MLRSDLAADAGKSRPLVAVLVACALSLPGCTGVRPQQVNEQRPLEAQRQEDRRGEPLIGEVVVRGKSFPHRIDVDRGERPRGTHGETVAGGDHPNRFNMLTRPDLGTV